MNKKGTLIHWIIFGLLVALGVFFIMSEESKVGVDVKGEWQLDFLKENFLEAEKKLLRTDSIVKNIGTKLALDLAENGGFKQGAESDCGKYNNDNMWNKKNEWCFTYQNLSQIVINITNKRLKEKIPNKTFSEINSNGFFLIGTGEPDSIVTENARYTYDTSFAVNLGYSFEEYLLLEQEAHRLVTDCRNEKTLKNCLDRLKLNYWKYSSCDAEDESYSENARKVLFCVMSPNLAYLLMEGDVEQKLITYKLALDFTPTKPFMVEEVEASYDTFNNFYEISFEEDLLADSYKIYFTDYIYIEGEGGDPAELEDNVLATFFWEHKEFKAGEVVIDIDKCASGAVKEANKAYLCEEKIFFTLSDARLVENGDYLFGVTTVKDGQESEIKELVRYI